MLLRLLDLRHGWGQFESPSELEGPASHLLLQTIVTADRTADRGDLIKAVTVPWFEIIAALKKNRMVAYEIPADTWEQIIAGAYKLAGFDEVILTPRSGDFGRDIIAIKRGLLSVRIIDQVKAYTPPRRVTADDVRALIGVLHCDGASKGFLTTTSEFAPGIRHDPFISPLIPSRLELIDGKLLIDRLEELALAKQ